MVQAGPRALPGDDDSPDVDRGDIEKTSDDVDGGPSERTVDLVAGSEDAQVTAEIPKQSNEIKNPAELKMSKLLSDSFDAGSTSTVGGEPKSIIRSIDPTRISGSSYNTTSDRRSVRRGVLALLGLLIAGSAFLAFRSQAESETDSALVDEQSIVANFDPEIPEPPAQPDDDRSITGVANEDGTSDESDRSLGSSSTTEPSQDDSSTLRVGDAAEPVGGQSTGPRDSSVEGLTDSTEKPLPTTSKSGSDEPLTTIPDSSVGSQPATTRKSSVTTRQVTARPTTSQATTTRQASTTRRTTTTRQPTTTRRPTTTRVSTTRAPTTTRATTTTRAPTTTRPPTTRPPSTIGGFQELDNNGFEQHNVPAGERRLGTYIGWWSDTGVVEVWGSGYDGVDAVDGRHLIELNSVRRDSIYQRVNTTPGATYRWSFYHRGRDGQDSIQILLDGRSIATRSSGLTWTRHTGEFVLLPGQTSIEFGLRAVDEGSRGNLVDLIELVKEIESNRKTVI